MFGQSSEQVAYSQLSVFDEAEKFSDNKSTEPTIEDIQYQRKKTSTAMGKKDRLANLEKVVIEHKFEESEQICDTCDEPLEVIGRKSKEVLKYIPAKLYIEEHVTYSYGCNACEEKEDKANIITTKAPATLLHKSMASNELLSHAMVLKYQHALPLYRQEQYLVVMSLAYFNQLQAKLNLYEKLSVAEVERSNGAPKASHNEFMKNYRMLIIDAYIVFYIPNQYLSEIEIMRVLYSKQNYNSFL